MSHPEINLKQILLTPLHFINGIQHHYPPCCVLSFCIENLLNHKITTTKGNCQHATCAFHTKNPSNLKKRTKAKFHISYDKRLPDYPVYIAETAIDTFIFNLNKKQILKEEGSI